MNDGEEVRMIKAVLRTKEGFEKILFMPQITEEIYLPLVGDVIQIQQCNDFKFPTGLKEEKRFVSLSGLIKNVLKHYMRYYKQKII
jgi:hypothetical protein